METHLSGKKILWIEDDTFLGNIVEKKLQSTGSSLTMAKDGETAISLLEKETPDIIVADIILPGIDGFEVVKRVKESPKTKDVPIIMLSNLGHVEDIEKGRRYGANLFLVKAAVNLDEVIEKMAELIKTHPVT